jgi:hypothetical protein
MIKVIIVALLLLAVSANAGCRMVRVIDMKSDNPIQFVQVCD